VRRLVLLRHGESVWNAEGRVQGQQGAGLTDLGHEFHVTDGIVLVEHEHAAGEEADFLDPHAPCLAEAVVLVVAEAFNAIDARRAGEFTRESLVAAMGSVTREDPEAVEGRPSTSSRSTIRSRRRSRTS
jgi:hypothetical protein